MAGAASSRLKLAAWQIRLVNGVEKATRGRAGAFGEANRGAVAFGGLIAGAHETKSPHCKLDFNP